MMVVTACMEVVTAWWWLLHGGGYCMVVTAAWWWLLHGGQGVTASQGVDNIIREGELGIHGPVPP